MLLCVRRWFSVYIARPGVMDMVLVSCVYDPDVPQCTYICGTRLSLYLYSAGL